MAINMNTYNYNLLNFRTISFYNVKFRAKTKELSFILLFILLFKPSFTFIDYIYINIENQITKFWRIIYIGSDIKILPHIN